MMLLLELNVRCLTWTLRAYHYLFFFFSISTVPLQVALDLNKQHCHSTAYTVQQIIII